MEDLVVKSVRFTPSDWGRVERAAQAFQIEPTVMVRRIVLRKLDEMAEEVERRLGKATELPF